MGDIQSALQRAVDDNVISAEQLTQLRPYVEDYHDTETSDEELLSGLEKPKDYSSSQALNDSEAPRFVRGFHDILITIGVVIILLGFGTLTSPILIVFGAWGLAEILVKRQRLALPAVVLTLIYIGAIGFFVGPMLDDFARSQSPELTFVVASIWFPIALLPFYWRFRVPIALSMMIVSVGLFAFAIVLWGIGAGLAQENIFETAPLIFNLVGLFAALVLFSIAIWFDIQDPTRIKRYSDVAFWLHLVCAPLLFYTVMSLIFSGQSGAFWWTQQPSVGDAVIVILCVVVMMFVGLIIDRRAFVTAGLISLIAAVVVIFQESDLSFDDATGVALFAVGIVILLFGVGWPLLRPIVLGLLPQFIIAAVPPAHRAADKAKAV